MTEEEKEAIKYFLNLRATIDESYMLFDEEINVKCGKEIIKQISIILNLIEKQQIESEKKDKIIEKRDKLIKNISIKLKRAWMDLEEIKTQFRKNIVILWELMKKIVGN